MFNMMMIRLIQFRFHTGTGLVRNAFLSILVSRTGPTRISRLLEDLGMARGKGCRVDLYLLLIGGVIETGC